MDWRAFAQREKRQVNIATFTHIANNKFRPIQALHNFSVHLSPPVKRKNSRKKFMTTLAILWDPSLGIDFGFFTLRFYSLMWFAAFICGVWIMTKVGRRDGLSDEQLTSMLFYVFFGTLIGARLGHCIFYEWGYYKDHLVEMILPVQFSPKFRITGYEGLASHGAAVGIVVAMLLYARRIKKSFLWVMDRLCMAVAAGGVFIRVGNFFNSEIIGKPTESSFGVIFKRLGEDFPRHPAQLYEALGYLVLFVALWVLYKKGYGKKEGFLFGLFLIALFSIRFVIEFFKENQEAFEDSLPLNMGQLLSIPFILAGAVILYLSVKRKNKL